MTAIFYCTTGRGTECFAMQEIGLCPSAEVLHCSDGKIFFSTSTDSDLTSLKNLKTVERLFVCVHYTYGFKWKGYKKFKAYMTAITKWKTSYEVWKQFSANSDHLEPPPCKLSKTINASSISDIPSHVTFRVSCKAGRLNKITSSQISEIVSKSLFQRYGWCTNLQQPTIEISINASPDHLVVGIPLFKKPLSLRPYMQHFGLRSTIAHIMCKIADIESSEQQVILDPMCGTGVILVEAAQLYPGSTCLGCDISSNQLTKAVENIQRSSSHNVHLIHADTRHLPLPSQFIDAAVCDLPFGINHCVGENLEALYTDTVAEIDRVLKIGGRCVLLTSVAHREMLLRTVEQATQWYRDANVHNEANCHNSDTSVHSKNTLYKRDASTNSNNCKCSDKVLCDNSRREQMNSCARCSATVRQQCRPTLCCSESCEYSGAVAWCTSSDGAASLDASHVTTGQKLDDSMDACETSHAQHNDTACAGIQTGVAACNTSFSHDSNTLTNSSTQLDNDDTATHPQNNTMYEHTTQLHVCTVHHNDQVYDNSRWLLCGTHYLKLGETHATVVVFRKVK